MNGTTAVKLERVTMYEVVIRQLPGGAEVNKQEITDEQYQDIVNVLTGAV